MKTIFNVESPVAQGRAGDGIVTAAEVGLLNLKNTWLVTLSACDTAGGRISPAAVSAPTNGLSDWFDDVMIEEGDRFLVEVPRASHLTDDSPLSADYYVRHRVETIWRIWLTARTDALALAHMVGEDYEAARLWANYIAEEIDHDRHNSRLCRSFGVLERVKGGDNNSHPCKGPESQRIVQHHQCRGLRIGRRKRSVFKKQVHNRAAKENQPQHRGDDNEENHSQTKH